MRPPRVIRDFAEQVHFLSNGRNRWLREDLYHSGVLGITVRNGDENRLNLLRDRSEIRAGPIGALKVRDEVDLLLETMDFLQLLHRESDGGIHIGTLQDGGYFPELTPESGLVR